ncbi:coiled-coil domain-containing protein 114 [Anableps anableps]
MAQGRSAMSGRSENTEISADDVAKLEIAELQNQFRIMKVRDQRSYEFHARNQIYKQEQEIGRLLKERDELHKNLAACKSLSHQRQDQKDIQALEEQNSALDREMENEKQRQKQLQIEISSMESRLAEMRKGGGSSVYSQSSKARRTKKALRNLESNVNRVSTQFSDLMTKNTKLKDELNVLCLERDHFQKLRNNLIKELQKIRKSIEEMTKLCTAAYNTRKEALSKMTILRDKTMKDLIQYYTETKELERIIAYEFNLKNFIGTKCSKEMGQFDKWHQNKVGTLADVKEPMKMSLEEQSTDNLKEVFEKLQAEMGEDNLEHLVTNFIQAKDRNFALLKFVNVQNSEAVKLTDQISKIKEEMEKFHHEGLQREQKHQSLLKDMEETLKETKSQAETFENQADILSKILDEIKTGVNNIFSEIGCDQSGVEDKLGFSSGISENIMTYLDVIEEKTNELLTVEAFLKFKDLKEDFDPTHLARSLLGQNPEFLKQDLSTYPSVSSLEYNAEESPIIDEEEWPLSHEELRRQILKRKSESTAPTRSNTSLKSQSQA